jgi:L-amino acid N-acyltransferase YncA
VRAEINFGNRASINLVTRLGFSLVGKDYEENDDIFEMRRDTWTKL